MIAPAPTPETKASAPSATPAQRRAIEARGGDVCVSAGAGSGKTFVLVERFMSLVRDDEIHPERLLTITFTDKAAREMADRIGRALEAIQFPHARRVAEGAWISTIHGFCARLLRERALEAGVDPGFTVLTDVPAARIRRDAFLRAQRSFRAAHPGTYDALVERVRWGKRQDGLSGIRRQVFALYDAMRAAGAQPREWDEAIHLDALDHQAVQVAFERLAEGIRWLLSTCAAEGSSNRIRERRLTAIASISARISASPLDVFRLDLHRDLQALVKNTTGGGKLKEVFAEAHRAALRAAGAYAEGPARALGRGLEDLLLRFDHEFRALKAELSALDFTDLEERTRELLEGRPDVREEVQRRFEAVLVDEFQDTSRLQQRIVDLVRRPGGLFAVGDVKQSIYGFRHAEVQGLLGLERETEANGGEVVVLDRSFRTRPEVLALVDEVFERVWSEPGSEVEPQSLEAGIEFPPAPRPCLEMILGRGDDLRRARAHEARAVAARIATLVEGQQLVGTNRLRADTFGQPLRYRDCAILLPATTALPAYERALRERGVPYRVTAGRGFHKVREVIDAVTLLKVTANAHDDLALLALLRSPVVGLSDAALMVLSGMRRPKSSLFSALRRVVEAAEPKLDAEDLTRALSAVSLVDGLRDLRGRASTRDILAHGLERSGLLDGSLLRGGDLRGFANLEKLLEVIDDLEREGVTGPGTIAQVLEDLRQADARESEANVASDDEDAVSILTVHGSKGLEWPLVVVADLGRYRRPGNDPVMWSAESGVTLNLRDPDKPEAITPLSLLRLAETEKTRQREESKRLLYVAMTRARDHLILAGAQSFRAKTAGDWLAWTRSPLDTRQHLAVEQDVAAGGLAKGYPTRGGLLVRCLEISEDLEGTPIHGVVGPAAGARPVLDAPECNALAWGRIPELPPTPPELDAQAAALLDRVATPCLPPLDHGASVYTVSELLTWRTCPRRALFEHVLGAAEGEAPVGGPGGGEVPADLRGTLAHELLARLVDGKRVSARAAGERLTRLLAQRGLTVDPEAVARAAKRALRWGKRFLESELGRAALASEHTRTELPFLVRLAAGGDADDDGDDTLLRGTLDLLTPGREGGWILADYKASEITALEVPSRLAVHELQVQVYALALSRLGVRLEAGLVVYLVPEVVSRVDLSPEALEGVAAQLREHARAREALDLPPTPGSACRRCPWASSCDAADLGGGSGMGGMMMRGSSSFATSGASS